jgi:hypothetical protein
VYGAWYAPGWSASPAALPPAPMVRRVQCGEGEEWSPPPRE